MLFKRNFLLIGLFSFIFSMFLHNQKTANASLLGAYKAPPSSEIAQKRTVSSGSRSNCQSSWGKNSLTLLIPESQKVHLTSQKRPNLYFHANLTDSTANSSSLKFNLVSIRPHKTNTIMEKTIQISRSGIHQITLPDNVTLKPNKIYLWQIAIPCHNSNRVAQTIRAGIQKIDVSPSLKNKINSTSSSLTKAKIYAEHGFWYDALFQAQQNDDTDSFQYFKSLLKDQDINLNLSPNKTNS